MRYYLLLFVCLFCHILSKTNKIVGVKQCQKLVCSKWIDWSVKITWTRTASVRKSSGKVFEIQTEAFVVLKDSYITETICSHKKKHLDVNVLMSDNRNFKLSKWRSVHIYLHIMTNCLQSSLIDDVFLTSSLKNHFINPCSIASKISFLRFDLIYQTKYDQPTYKNQVTLINYSTVYATNLQYS